MAIYSVPSQNAIQKQLDATLSAGASSLTLNEDISALFPDLSETNPGVLVVDRINAAGEETASKREYITFTGMSGASVTGLGRNADGSGSDQEHAVGAIIEFLPDVLWAQSIRDTFETEHNADGTHSTTHVVTPTGTQTLTNKTLTSPKIGTAILDTNGNEVVKTPATTDAVNEITITNAATGGAPSVTTTGGDTNINLVLSGKGTGLVIPELALAEGQMLNGKIVPSVSSNNLTVALKTIQGNDPSANDPIYVRIGDSIRAITSALSVTKNAGTNWCNAGSAELATKEVDYFVYLGYNATDGVVIGFSRIPYGTRYDSFSATSTAESYCAISTITNAAAGDYYTVIGRFAATLSAGAGYTWTVPTFTATNLIQRPIYETRRLYAVPTLTWFGGSTDPGTATNNVFSYIVSGNIVYYNFWWYKSSTDVGANRTSFQATVPFTTAGSSTDRSAGGARESVGSTESPLSVITLGGEAVIRINGVTLSGSTSFEVYAGGTFFIGA